MTTATHVLIPNRSVTRHGATAPLVKATMTIAGDAEGKGHLQSGGQTVNRVYMAPQKPLPWWEALWYSERVSGIEI